MKTERITFTGHDGTELAARLDLPDGPRLATALFAHCFTCSPDILPARRIAARLTAAGIAVLRFDFTGLGHDGGEIGNTGFTPQTGDLLAAAGALDARGMAPDLMIGHSLAGAAVLKVAAGLESVRAVVTLGAPFAPDRASHNFAGKLEERLEGGLVEVDLGGRKFRIGKDFLDDIHADNLAPAIHGLKAALLVMHAPRDQVVGIDNAQEIFRAALHPKSFVTLDDSDHLISRAEDAEYAAGVIAAWAARYLDLQPPAPPEGAPEGVIRVTEADPDGYLQDVVNGPYHHLLSDEPEAYGGTNRGLSPYGLLSAGLGSCTSMTIRMYARRKGWPLDSVRVDVTHAKVHAEDAATDDRSRPAKIDQFNRTIFLAGDLTDEQKARLVEIADRCPVHKTLHHANRIVTELAG